MRQIILMSVVFVAAALSACGQPNPLIGTWKLKPGQANAQFMPCTELRFEKKLEACGGLAEKVSYDVRDGEVIVHGASGLSAVYTVIEKNTISIEVPGVGTMVFGRYSY